MGQPPLHDLAPGVVEDARDECGHRGVAIEVLAHGDADRDAGGHEERPPESDDEDPLL